jgi:hypothetical protein
MYLYSISGNSWSTYSYTPASFSFSTGTHAVYDPDKNHVYICLNEGYRYIYRLDLNTATIEPFAKVPIPYYREARRLVLVKKDNTKFLYVFRGHEGSPFALWRIPVFF